VLGQIPIQTRSVVVYYYYYYIMQKQVKLIMRTNAPSCPSERGRKEMLMLAREQINIAAAAAAFPSRKPLFPQI